MVRKKRSWSWAIFFAGFLLGALGLWGPIHEFCHLIIALIEGGRITSFKWTFIGIENAGPLTAYAGSWGEAIFLIGLVYFLRRWKLRWFPWGSLHWPLIYSPFSSDFGVRARMLGGVSETGIWIGRISWVVFAVLVLVLGWITMIYLEKGERHERIGTSINGERLFTNAQGGRV